MLTNMRAIPSILVIDDNGEALEMVSSLLSILGAKKISQAKSAEVALEILQTETFSLIISDYRLEGMDGIQLLEQLRAEGNQTPVLLLSGAPDRAIVTRAKHHPNVDFYGKPFEISDLVSAVERLTEAA
jgi:two-component system C4-dicarboxylate transport response regulator DctD